MGTNSESKGSTGQVSTTAAEVYEEFFVPALFAQWVAPMLDAVDAHPGDRVIDIGTGTACLPGLRYDEWVQRARSSR